MANEFIARKGIISSGSLRITTGSLTSADFISGSRGLFAAVTSSLFGTSSWAQNAISSSFAATASYIEGGLEISNGLSITGSLVVSGSGIFTGSLAATQGITGSLLGTSSWAQFAVTASYVSGAASDWNSLANKPEGLVSSSLQINTGSFSGSFIGEAKLTSSGHFLPLITDTYDLGSSDKRWRALYVSGSTIYLGGLELKDTNNRFTVENSSGDILPISGSFTGSLFGTSSLAQTASIAYQIPAYTGSIAIGTTPYTGSFSGSFVGDGTLLTNVGNCTISGSAPTENVEVGDLWYEDTTGKTYVYYVSASVSSWVLQSDPTYVPDPTIQDLQDVTDIGSVTNNKITINNATESTSTGVGALLVAGGIGVGGNINAGGTVTEGSDERIKQDIVPLTDALNIVKQLEGVKFKYKKDLNTIHVGLIAQRTLPVLPEVVHGSEEHGYGIAYSNIVAVLIEAIKEQQQQIDELKAKLAE